MVEIKLGLLQKVQKEGFSFGPLVHDLRWSLAMGVQQGVLAVMRLPFHGPLLLVKEISIPARGGPKLPSISIQQLCDDVVVISSVNFFIKTLNILLFSI